MGAFVATALTHSDIEVAIIAGEGYRLVEDRLAHHDGSLTLSGAVSNVIAFERICWKNWRCRKVAENMSAMIIDGDNGKKWVLSVAVADAHPPVDPRASTYLLVAGGHWRGIGRLLLTAQTDWMVKGNQYDKAGRRLSCISRRVLVMIGGV